MGRARNKDHATSKKTPYQKSLRPRRNIIPDTESDTSIESSFDILHDKNGDETYVPSGDEYSVTKSTDIEQNTYLNVRRSLSPCSVPDKNQYKTQEPNVDEYLVPSQQSTTIVTKQIVIATDTLKHSVISDLAPNGSPVKMNVFAADSYNSFIDNSNTSNMLSSIRTKHNNTHIPANVTEESFFSTSTPTPKHYSPSSEPTNSKKYKDDIAHSPDGFDSFELQFEFDDSDKDPTFNPSSDDETNDSKSTNDSPLNDQCTKQKDRAMLAEEHPLGRKFCDSRKLKVTTENNTKENETKKMTRIRSKDHCFFCDSEVLNYARHIQRNHFNEFEVQKIFSYPKNSSIRKKLYTELRKKGNYLINILECVKPMKKSILHTDCLPCSKCLGFYSRKQLWKHRKMCTPLATTSNAQVEAQNFMLRGLNVDSKLMNEVFPKMRPDKVSLVAKKDPIICAFGAQYLRIHREKHFINVTSRKMRELAKLLIEIKTINNTIRDLMDCLKPQHYNIIVIATKKVASYDEKTDRYSAPTYAMNISTSLKQCCNIAIMETLKHGKTVSTATIEADLKTLIQLIEGNWKFDVSSQASNDLNIKKWNKITIVPLANDLKILKNFLSEKAALTSSQLISSKTSNVDAYKTLLETVYCRVILLNRRRPGELQRLLLSTYQECNKDDNAYEEFDRVISNTEKMLVKSFKRIVIRGKRGRGVPVLFTDDVQRDINLLVSVRRQYISDSNDYIFAKPGCETPLCGYKVLEKYAKSCNAKNPKALTSTKLRKHLATLTQMLNLKDTDIEQLANFMGHTQSVHRKNYRLPDDVYQTAKISKLLLLMESGNADNYKGKNLDEIELDMEKNLFEEATNDDERDDFIEYDILETLNQQPINQEDNNTMRKEIEPKALDDVTNTDILTRTGKTKRNLVPWTSQQKKIVLNFFKNHINAKRPPKRHECEELRNRYPEILNNKNWLKIKVFIQNTYTKK